MSLVYLDSSALAKLVVREPESPALLALLREHDQRVSSTLAVTELPQALRRAGFGAAERRRARDVLAAVTLVEVDRRILSAAGPLEPPTLRTLDAIHLATALELGDGLGALVTYDRRLAEAATGAHVPVLAPR